MSAEHDSLLRRLKVAMDSVRARDLTLDELCRMVSIVEGAAERAVGPADNVITFATCRRRKAGVQSARRRSRKFH
jgi:hypothetical protein